jgi:ketosteroid isomerase-like protein
MPEWIAGNPFFLVAASGCLTAILVLMYFQMIDTRLVPFMAAGMALTIMPLLLDVAITTDREAIRRTVQRLARSVRQNDLPATLKFAHPAAPDVYDRMEREMPNYDFSLCTISGFRKIEVAEGGDDAEVTFRVFVNVQAKRGPQGTGTREVVLNLRKTSQGDWKIMNYRHYDPFSRR